MTFIDNWRAQWLKFWSVRLTLIGNAMLAVLLAFPDVAWSAWSSLPEDVRAMVPVRVAYWIPVFIFAAATMARVVKQGKADGE